MILGYVLVIVGIVCAVFTGNAILQDTGYTYVAPYTTHEITMLVMFVAFLIVFLAGICVIVASVLKKRSEDAIERIKMSDSNGKRMDVCPKCGLNVSANTKVCPKCGYILKKERR